MAARKQSFTREIKNGVKEITDDAHEHPWVDRLTRVGYAVRGLIYGLIGYLAAQVFITGRAQITDQTGALTRISQETYGEILLVVILVGLVGLVIWGVVRAIADPYHKGKDLKGLVSRAGYLVSGISYAVLLVPVLKLLNGTGGASGGSSDQAQSHHCGAAGQHLGNLVGGACGHRFNRFRPLPY